MGEQLTKIVLDGVVQPFHDCSRYVLNDSECHSESDCLGPCRCDLQTHHVDDEEESTLKLNDDS